jgi:hypothetical protein
MISQDNSEDRRRFLQSGVAVAAGAAAVPFINTPAASSIPPGPKVDSSKMPMVQLGGRTVSRLILGANPIWGFSHRGQLMKQLMQDWNTPDRVVETLQHAERCGITAWQTSLHYHFKEDWVRYKENGGTMDLILQIHPYPTKGVETSWWELRKEMLALKPLALVHLGVDTDYYFDRDEIDLVKDTVKRLKDDGLPVGCASHDPKYITRMDEEGFEADYFTCCFYNVMKSQAEWQREAGIRPMGEVYEAGMPDVMTAVMRQVSRPCIGYKILAAGRIDRSASVEKAFKYALDNIKITDGLLVGMFPKFTDQIAENANYIIQHGQV